MDQFAAVSRFRDLQAYLDWSEADEVCIRGCGPLLAPGFASIVADFYARIDGHPEASRFLSGDGDQRDRLKASLLAWLEDLFRGPYDEAYAVRRWKVGLRHAEIGLDLLFYNVAMARIRNALQARLQGFWPGEDSRLTASSLALNKLLDLDLALVGDAYQKASLAREQRIERLATLGRIAGGVAHELRNPLNVIKTSVYYLQRAVQASREKQLEHLLRIERHVELADGVVSALDGFVRVPEPQPSRVPVKPALTRAMSGTPGVEKLEVTLIGLDDLPAVAVDEEQLRTVFNNLIRNACEAMPGGGSLRISGEARGDSVDLSFRDDGPGIPEDQLGQIQEPFFTTKPRGLGLGLTITRSILDKNRGQLLVESEPGRGSTFTLRLPLRVTSPRPPAPRSEARRPGDGEPN